MQESIEVARPRVQVDGARDLQAKLYREIGIAAVAAALHSINLPEPGKRPLDAPATPRSQHDRAFRAA